MSTKDISTNNISSNKKLQVSAIENGTVLDHIPSEHLFRVIEILHLRDNPQEMTLGTNLSSKTLGKKALIKLAGKYFEDEELNKIALFAPSATVNIIKDFEVVEKKILSIPETVKGIVKCMNPMCVTNHEEIETKFTTIKENGQISLFCHYCEKITDNQNFKLVRKSR